MGDRAGRSAISKTQQLTTPFSSLTWRRSARSASRAASAQSVGARSPASAASSARSAAASSIGRVSPDGRPLATGARRLRGWYARRLEGAELGHGAAVGRRLLAQPAPGAGDEGPGVGRPRDLRRRAHRDAGAAAEVEAVRDQRARPRRAAAAAGSGSATGRRGCRRAAASAPTRSRAPGSSPTMIDAEPAVGEQRRAPARGATRVSASASVV